MPRTQPLQNVIAAFVVMTLLSTASLFLELPLPHWTVPPLWTSIVLNSRGVAKLLLLPCRSAKGYGFWLIALASVLATVLMLPLKPSFIWLPFAAALQFLTVPWLIEKKPAVPPPNFFPLWVWVALALGAIVYVRSFATQ
jgi:hypothetical protein